MSLLRRIFGKSEEVKEDKSNTDDLETRFNQTLNLLAPYKRVAYVPAVTEQEPSFSDQSKIGGYPYLRNVNDWPVCPNCKRNMQLFLQLDVEEIPNRKDFGLIQLFYCTSESPHCESDLEAFFPFSKGVNCRKIQVGGASAQVKPIIDEVFPEKVITGWSRKDDYPHYEEYDQLGISFDIDDDISDLMFERDMGVPLSGDKMLGWPHWVQSVEYPNDRKTSKQMKLLFQLDSEDNLPYMFGDSGIGHLTESPDNENELGFGWACY